MTARPDLIAQAVELTTLITDPDLGRDMPQVRLMVMERLVEAPMHTVIGMAHLTGAIARMAEAMMDDLLADPEGLRVALANAEAGTPIRAHQLGVGREELLRLVGRTVAAMPS